MKNRLSKKAGAKIVIHDPNTPPLPNEYGLELRPNTASSIAVQVTFSAKGTKITYQTHIWKF